MERNMPRQTQVRPTLPLWRAAWLATTGLSALALLPAAARAQSIAPDTTPQGGAVAAGNATILQAPGATTIDQASPRTVINWQSFNVGSAASVQFNQPSASAIALNRVTTPSPSIIAGQINANGQIILINQSGVIVSKGADINAESIVLATSNISDKDFMAGNLVFSGAPQPGAKIINDGNITVKDTGLVGLVAPQVENNGVITARLGVVSLAGAAAFTLDLYGDRLISLDVTKAVRAVDVGGKLVAALVTNRGLILADGGTITLTAQDADALVTQLVDAGGTLRADAVGAQPGAINITGVGGDISIAGNLLARGAAPGTKGGSIEALTTGTIAIAQAAVLDTSGAAGGGVIALGTDIQRARAGTADTTAPKAAATEIAAGASLKADATGKGDGGKITILSSQDTDDAGAISATGGSLGGNGGAVEISGDAGYALTGPISVAAPLGNPGDIIIDPGTLIIESGGGGHVISDGNAGGTLYSFGNNTASLDPIEFTTLSGNVELIGNDEISIQSSIVSGSLNSLILESPTIASGALGGITLSGTDARLSLAANTLSLGATIAAATIELAPFTSGTAETLTAADAAFIANHPTLLRLGAYTPYVPLGSAASALDVTASSLSFGAGSSGTLLPAGTIELDSTGAISQPAGGLGLQAGELVIGKATSVSLASSFNLLDTLVSDVTTTGLLLNDQPDLLITGTVADTSSISLSGADLTEARFGVLRAPDISLSAPGGTVSLDGLVTATSGVALNAPVGAYISSTGTLSAPIVSITSGLLDISGALDAASRLALDVSGAIFEDTGSISAGELLTTGSIPTGITLASANNSIGTLDAASSGLVDIFDSAPVTIAPTLIGSSVLLASPTISFGAAGASLAATGGTLALSTNAFSLSTGNTLLSPGGTIEIAPFSANTVLGLGDPASSSTLGINQALVNILDPSATLILGHGAAGAQTASSIRIDGALSFSGTGLTELVTTGQILDNTGTLNAANLLLAAAGVAQNPAAAIDAATLAGIGTFTGNILLPGTANLISDLGGFDLGGGTLSLNDTASLTVGGALEAGAITLAAATLDFSANVNDTGLLALGSLHDITQSSGTISAGTLASIGTIGGNVSLTDPGNDITTLANFTLPDSGGGSGVFDLSDGAALAIPGTLIASNASISAPGLDLTGGITLFSDLTLSSGAGMTLGGSISVGQYVALLAAGPVTESGGITAGTLGGGADGNVALTGTNTIGALAAFTAGDFSLSNSSPLTIAGALGATSATLAAPSIAIGAGISVASNLVFASITGGITQTSGVIIAPTLASTGSIGGNVLLAGDSITTLGAFALGSTGTFDLADLTSLTVAGPLDGGTGSISAAGISLAGNISMASALTLASSGAIMQSPTASIATPVLYGAATGAAYFSGTNAIATLATFSAADFSLTDDTGLSIASALTADAITLAADGSLAIAAPINATTGNVVLVSNGLSLGSGVTVAAPATIALAPFTPGPFTFSSAASAFIASTLAIGAADGFAATTLVATGASSFAGTLLLDASSLVQQTGSLGAQEIDFSAPSLSLGGAISAAGLLSLASTGLASDTGTLSAGILDFSTGSLVQGPGAGPITAGTLAGAGNGVTLASLANQIGTLGAISLSSGDFVLGDGTGLAVAAPLHAGAIAVTDSAASGISLSSAADLTAGSISLAADVLSAAGGAALTATATTLSPYGAPGIDLGGSMANALDLGQAVFTAAGGSQFLQIGTGAAAITADGALTGNPGTLRLDGTGISFTSALTAPGVLELEFPSSGTVSESNAAAINTPSLAGIGVLGNVLLANGHNTIGSIGSLDIGGTQLSLADATALTVAGNISAPNLTLAAPGISVSGNLSAASEAVLNATSSIGISGAITTGTGGAGSGILILGLSGAGEIAESPSGTLATGTLGSSGGIAGSVALTSANNAIGTLGSFSATNFELEDGVALSLAGPLTAPIITLAAPGISISGSIEASLVLALLSTGGLTQDDAITAGTLTSGGGADAGDVLLTNATNSIGTLGAFSLASGEFQLADGVSLAVAGALTAPAATLSAPSIGITGAINTTEQLSLNGAGGIAIAGPVNAGTLLNLASAGTIAETGPAGTITVRTLAGLGILGGDLDLGRANAIGTLGGFLLPDGNLDVTDTTPLAVAGTLTAQNTTLAATALDLTGTLLTTDALDLTSASGDITLGAGALASAGSGITLTSAGAIGEASGGTLITPVLTGASSGGGTNLAGIANRIGTLFGFTAAGSLLVEDTGLLNAQGTIAATNITLAAGTLGLDASLLAPAGTLALSAFAGGIAQSGGSLSAAVLTGGGSLTTGSVELERPGNTIGTVGAFAVEAPGSFALADAGTLSVAGPLTAGNVTLAATGGLLIPGSISTGILQLGAGASGSITEAPSAQISATSLAGLGATTGAVSLLATGNQIGTLGAFNSGDFSLADASALDVTGPLTAPIVRLTAAGLEITGAISASSLADLSGTDGITLAAAITTGTLALASSAGGVTQNSGILSAGTLTGSIAAATELGDANLLATLASFTDGGNLTLTTAEALTATGVTAANITLAAAGLTLAGPLDTGTLALASSAGVSETTGTLTATDLTTGGNAVAGAAVFGNSLNSLGTLGPFNATGGLTLNDATGLVLNGAVDLGGTLALDAASLTQTAGSVSAGALTSNGGTIGGLVLFTQPGNLIPKLGNFAAGGNISITDADPLSLLGAITAGGGLTLVDTGGAITENGGVVATRLFNGNASAISLTDANTIGALGSISTTGGLVVNGVAGISGPVAAGSAALTNSTGGFVLAGSTDVAGQLFITAADNIDQQSGSIAAQNATFSAANIILSGTDTIPGKLDLLGTGDVTQTAGQINAGLLTGTGTNLASFGLNGAVADIGTLGSFILGDSAFDLNNSGPLTLIGPIAANIIRITANGLLTLDGSSGGGLYITGGTLSSSATLAEVEASNASELAATSILQTGGFDINYPVPSSYLGTDPTPATILFLTAASADAPGGDITFGGAPGGLNGNDIDAVISAGTQGKVTGNVDFQHLEILSAGVTDLTGTLDNVTGQAAAGKGSVVPEPLSKYQFNACPIGSVNCVVLAIEGIPTINPLENFDISQRKRRRLDKNVQLPGIATHDF